MTNQCELQLMNRCADYLHELAEIYGFGGTDNHHIVRDLERIKRLSRRCSDTNPPSPTQSSPVVNWCKALQVDERWADDVTMAYRQLGGQAWHPAVYRTVKDIRTAAGRSWPPNARSTIRQTLQAYNAESPQYRRGDDLFRMVRPGLWRLKDHKTQ